MQVITYGKLQVKETSSTSQNPAKLNDKALTIKNTNIRLINLWLLYQLNQNSRKDCNTKAQQGTHQHIFCFLGVVKPQD